MRTIDYDKWAKETDHLRERGLHVGDIVEAWQFGLTPEVGEIRQSYGRWHVTVALNNIMEDPPGWFIASCGIYGLKCFLDAESLRHLVPGQGVGGVKKIQVTAVHKNSVTVKVLEWCK